MARPARQPARSGRSSGFALILVLWTLVLIAFITAHLLANGRVELRIAENLTANAVADAAAEGAVYQAVFNVLESQPERRWDVDGTVHEITVGDCRVGVGVFDEAARINPNVAAPGLIEALLRVTGSDPEIARRLADAIGEWVGNPATPRSPETVAADYRATGLDYGPPGEPLETIDELQRVVGMTPQIFAAIRPHLSLFAPPEPVLAHADPVVAAAMAQIGIEQPATPPRPTLLMARIVATAVGRSNARATRTAIARIVPLSQAYIILSWGGGSD